MDETTLARLLHLYPVEALRERWATEKGQTKETLIDYVVKRVLERDIYEFCRLSHGLTKQHVRIFENSGTPLKDLADPLIDIGERTFFDRKRAVIEEFYLINVAYKAVIGPAPYKDVELDFLWPVRVVVDANHAVLAFTIIEKSISTYLGNEVTTLRVTKEPDEDGISVLFLGSQPTPGDFMPCDLNRGVKALWNGDSIDAEHVRYKSAASTRTEDMDAKRLMKRDEPAEFRKAMQAPLFKTVFQTLAGDYPHLFAVDPSKGQLFVTRYPKTATEVSNVVRAILAGN